jgi:hypothetical protein
MSHHHCHATNCKVPVPPEMFMCKPHWFALPWKLRKRIWAAYRPGQCDDWNPSRMYCMTAKEAVVFIAEQERIEPDTRLYDMFMERE